MDTPVIRAVAATLAAVAALGCEDLRGSQIDGARPWGYYATVCEAHSESSRGLGLFAGMEQRTGVSFAPDFDSAAAESWGGAHMLNLATGERNRFWGGHFDVRLGPVQRGDVVTVCMTPEVYRSEVPGSEGRIIRSDHEETYPPGSDPWCKPEGEPVPSARWTCDGWEPDNDGCYLPTPETEMGWKRICDDRGRPLPEFKALYDNTWADGR